MGGRASRWRRAAKKIGFPCGSFSGNDAITCSSPPIKTISCSTLSNVTAGGEETEGEQPKVAADKSLCMICLEPLGSSFGADDGKCTGVFTAQCTHAFHSACIASNVRHGSVTCPICRAHWSQLPRELTAPVATSCASNDPVLRILDDSIASSRVNRRSFLRSTRYDDDDPVDPDAAAEPGHPRLHFAIVPAPLPAAHCVNGYPAPFLHPISRFQLAGSPMAAAAAAAAHHCSPIHGQKRVCLSVRVSHQQATDVVLVASPNGPHLRLLKQSMALVVFSLRNVDRLAIVTHSNAAARAFPLRRMSAQGKRAALQVIDRLFYLGEAEPTEGLRKGVKILDERAHRNPQACILHLSDSPTRSYVCADLQFPIPVHRFHMGFGFGTSNGLVMHEFEEFLARLLGGVIRDAQLRVGDEEDGGAAGGGVVRLGELRGGEERRIPLELAACSVGAGGGGRNGNCGFVRIGYSYVEAGGEQRLVTGQTVVGMEDKGAGAGGGTEVAASGGDAAGGRDSCVERWDYLDPFMARRWAKHLHGYKL